MSTTGTRYIIFSQWPGDSELLAHEKMLPADTDFADLIEEIESVQYATSVHKLNFDDGKVDDISKEVAKAWAQQVLSDEPYWCDTFSIPSFIKANDEDSLIVEAQAAYEARRNPIYAPRLVNRYRARRVA